MDAATWWEWLIAYYWLGWIALLAGALIAAVVALVRTLWDTRR